LYGICIVPVVGAAGMDNLSMDSSTLPDIIWALYLAPDKRSRVFFNNYPKLSPFHRS
jgi:hypothetical protein